MGPGAWGLGPGIVSCCLAVEEEHILIQFPLSSFSPSHRDSSGSSVVVVGNPKRPLKA